jgi:hypothetical protein
MSKSGLYAHFSSKEELQLAPPPAELDTHPGPVRDALVRSQATWNDTLTALVERAREDGWISRGEEPPQLAFELNAFLHLANDLFVLHQNDLGIDRARRRIAGRLRMVRSVATRTRRARP